MLIVQSDIREQLTALVLLDFSSAFDTVDHTVYCPLCATGFQLTDQQHPDFSRTCQIVHRRSQRQSIMSPVELQCSVPQGSVLCPIQFIAYGGRSIPI